MNLLLDMLGPQCTNGGDVKSWSTCRESGDNCPMPTVPLCKQFAMVLLDLVVQLVSINLGEDRASLYEEFFAFGCPISDMLNEPSPGMELLKAARAIARVDI